MKRVSVRFADQEHEWLVKLSEDTEYSLNELILEAVRQYLESGNTKG